MEAFGGHHGILNFNEVKDLVDVDEYVAQIGRKIVLLSDLRTPVEIPSELPHIHVLVGGPVAHKGDVIGLSALAVPKLPGYPQKCRGLTLIGRCDVALWIPYRGCRIYRRRGWLRLSP